MHNTGFTGAYAVAFSTAGIILLPSTSAAKPLVYFALFTLATGVALTIAGFVRNSNSK